MKGKGILPKGQQCEYVYKIEWFVQCHENGRGFFLRTGDGVGGG